MVGKPCVAQGPSHWDEIPNFAAGACHRLTAVPVSAAWLSVAVLLATAMSIAGDEAAAI
jgi:hypothetical protein